MLRTVPMGAALLAATTARAEDDDRCGTPLRQETPLKSYLRKGDRVQRLDHDPDGCEYDIVRFVGTRRTTIGAVDPQALDCSAPPL